jgi:hypothetical protein
MSLFSKRSAAPLWKPEEQFQHTGGASAYLRNSARPDPISEVLVASCSDKRLVLLREPPTPKRIPLKSERIVPTADDVVLSVAWAQVNRWWYGLMPVPRSRLRLADHSGDEDVVIVQPDRDLAGFIDMVILPYSLDRWLEVLRASGAPESG